MQLPRDDTNHPKAGAFRAFIRDAGFPCVGADLTGWLWAGLIERISLDQRSWE